MVIVLLGFFVGASLEFAWTTSPVFDEPGFLRAGYANLRQGAAKSATGNLFFAPTWVSLPLLALHPTLPTDEDLAATDPARRELGRFFVFHPQNDWRVLIRSARAMNILLGLGLGLLVWQWSRSLFGSLGAGVSLAFYCFSPLMIANSAIATTDVAVTLWLLMALQRCWRLLHHVSVLEVVKCGAVLGVLFVTKVSGFIIVPISILLLAVRLASPRPLVVNLPFLARTEVSPRLHRGICLLVAAAAVGLVTMGTIWLCYAPTLTIFAYPNAAWPWASFAAQSHGPLGTVAERLHQWHLLPDSYLFDIRLFDSAASERRAYLLGDYSIRGWWYFFPLAWLFKTPLSFLFALVIGGGVLLGKSSLRRTAVPSGTVSAGIDVPRNFDLYELVPLLVLAALFTAAALASSLNIGVRHVLPIQPVLFIWAGACALAPLPRWRAWVLVVLVSCAAIEIARAAPEFMAYCNPVAGGTMRGHHALIDSSYEWGQDLPAVEQWLEARAKQPGGKPPVFFSYFGNADLSRFKLDAILLPQFYDLRPDRLYPLNPGTYIISATMLHTLYGPAVGPWRPSYERAYQQLTQQVRRLEALLPLGNERAMDLIRQEGEKVWAERIRLYDALRFARLCASLRQRQPDARITAGMLVFEINSDELQRALTAPPAELRTDFQIKGTEDIPQDQLTFLK